MSSLLLLLALAIAPANPPAAEPAAPTEPATPAAAATGCPPMSMPLPRYPFEIMRKRKPGSTLVRAYIDDCGRVLKAEVETGSGSSDLDKVSLDTVRTWVLGAEKRALVKGDQVLLPVGFGGVQTLSPSKPDWPKSHRRPYYREDAEPLGFATIAEFRAAKRVRHGQVLIPPYPPRRRDDGMELVVNFEQDAADDRTFWLSTLARKPTQRQDGGVRVNRAVVVGLARYRLVEEAGEPVVRLALLCEDTPGHCAELSAFLAEGLPSARARAE